MMKQRLIYLWQLRRLLPSSIKINPTLENQRYLLCFTIKKSIRLTNLIHKEEEEDVKWRRHILSITRSAISRAAGRRVSQDERRNCVRRNRRWAVSEPINQLMSIWFDAGLTAPRGLRAFNRQSFILLRFNKIEDFSLVRRTLTASQLYEPLGIR